MADIAKVKRNIQRMIDQNAPEADIDAYVASEGTSPDELRAGGSAPQSQGLNELSQLTQNADPSMGAKIAFQGMSPLRQLGTSVSDAVNLGMNGATMGFGNMAAAGMRAPFTDKSYDEELEVMRAGDQKSRDRQGTGGAIAEIGGSVLGAGKILGSGASFTKLAPQASSKIARMLGLSAGTSADALALNTLTNAGNDRELGENAGVAALAGGIAPAAGQVISGGLSKLAGMFNKTPKGMSGDQLKKAGVAALDRADAQGIMFTPQGMKRLRDDAVAEMTDFGFHPKNQPGAAVALEELERLASQNVTLKGLHSARKVAKGGFTPQNPSNNEALNRIVSVMDDALSKPQPGEVIGNVGAAARDFDEFKDLYSRGSKVKTVDRLVNEARLRAGSTGSGGNVDNATRQNLRQILTNKKTGRGFTPDEKAAVEKAVVGTKGQNLLRLAGKLSPQGNGLMAALGIGGTMVNPAVGVASLGGMGAKMIADGQTQKAVEKLTRLIASGGNSAALKAPKNTAQKMIENKRDVIMRALMMSGVIAGSQAGQP